MRDTVRAIAKRWFRGSRQLLATWENMNLTRRKRSAIGLAVALLLNIALVGVYDLSTVKCMHGRLSGTRDGCLAMSLTGYGLIASIGVTVYFLISLLQKKR